MLLTRAFTGLETNMLRPSIAAAGLDPDDLPARGAIDIAKDINAADGTSPTPGAGRTSGAPATRCPASPTCPSVAELVDRTEAEYRAARQEV